MPAIFTEVDRHTLKTVFKIEGLEAEFKERIDAEVVADALEREEVDPVYLADDILEHIDNTCFDELKNRPSGWDRFLDVLRPDLIDIIKDALREPK